MRTVHLIVGPPCAGKSTYVDQHKQPGDVVIDYDRLAQQAGSQRTHDHERQYRTAAGSRRWELEQQVERMRTGTAWVVRTLGDRQQREDTAQRLGADVTVIDPGGAECIRRAHEAGRPSEIDEVIVRWYAADWGSRALAVKQSGGTTRPTRQHPGLIA